MSLSKLKSVELNLVKTAFGQWVAKPVWSSLLDSHQCHRQLFQTPRAAGLRLTPDAKTSGPSKRDSSVTYQGASWTHGMQVLCGRVPFEEPRRGAEARDE